MSGAASALKRPVGSEGFRNPERTWEQTIKGLALSKSAEIRKLFGLSHREESILRLLVSRSNLTTRPDHLSALKNTPGFLVWKNVKTIADECSSGERTVCLALSHLKESGLIKYAFSSKGGPDRPSVYLVDVEGIANPANLAGFNPARKDAKPCRKKRQTLQEKTPNPAKTDTPYKEDNFTDNLTEQQHQQQQESGPAAEATALECEVVEEDVGVVVRSFIDQKPKDPFARLEHVCGEIISGAGRGRISRAGERHAFSLAQLEWFFTRRYGLQHAGGLIRLAEDWVNETAHVTEWPSCYECLGSGVELLPRIKSQKRGKSRWQLGIDIFLAERLRHGSVGVLNLDRLSVLSRLNKAETFGASSEEIKESLGHGTSFCSCEAGIKAEEQNRDNSEQQYMVSQATAARASAAAAQEVEKKKKEQADLARTLAEKQKRDELHAQNKCAECEGTGRYSTTEYKCHRCSGTGVWRDPAEWTAQGRCAACCGTGQAINIKTLRELPPKLHECIQCHGSGRILQSKKSKLGMSHV